MHFLYFLPKKNCSLKLIANPTVHPSACNGRVGTYPVPNTCTQFASCLQDGTRIVKQCPHGLHFHPVHRVCVWPYNYPCSNGRFFSKMQSYLQYLSKNSRKHKSLLAISQCIHFVHYFTQNEQQEIRL